MNSNCKPGGRCAIAVLCVLLFGGGAARASVAHGTVTNFDAVNGPGVPGHGFEIELDDCRSPDISYTYDYSHE